MVFIQIELGSIGVGLQQFYRRSEDGHFCGDIRGDCAGHSAVVYQKGGKIEPG